MPRKSKVGMTVETLGSYLREQRVAAELSLRQLAEQAGVSNPYLSQIERGLRRPSAEVLQALAKALRISAEQVYVQAGILKLNRFITHNRNIALLQTQIGGQLSDNGLLHRVQMLLRFNRRNRSFSFISWNLSPLKLW